MLMHSNLTFSFSNYTVAHLVHSEVESIQLEL